MPTEAPAPTPLRPRDIYPNMTKEDLKLWLGRHKPLAFRVPKDGEYFVATKGEQRNDRVSRGYAFDAYKCYGTWAVPTPRFIITKTCHAEKRYGY